MSETLDPEVALLGIGLYYSDKVVQRVALKCGLRPDHFDQPLNGRIWQAMLDLTDRPDGVADLTTVAGKLGLDATAGSRHALPHEAKHLYDLQDAGATVLVSGCDDYAARIIERARARHAGRIAERIKVAADAVDLGEVAALADQVLPPDDHVEQESHEALMEELWRHAEKGRSTSMRWGNMPVLNDLLDGFWPGHFTIVGGHEAHGKSIFVDQIGERLAHAHDATMCIYATEMTAFERAQRSISRYSGIPFDAVRRGRIDGGLMADYQRAMNRIPWRFEVVGPRSGAELARDIRRRGWTVAVIDLLNFVPGRPGDTRPRREQLEDNVRELANCATETGTAIIAVNHLNRNRQGMGDYPPEPILDDLRETKVLQQAATNVLFVYREPRDNDPRLMSDVAYVEVAKAKNGRQGRQQLEFDGKHQRFLLPRDDGSVSKQGLA